MDLGEYYRVLGVAPTATTSEIKARYRSLVKQHHPDRHGDAKTMARINEAYKALSNPLLRYKYSQTVHAQTKTTTNTPKKPEKTTTNVKHWTGPVMSYKDEPTPHQSYKRLFWFTSGALVGLLLLFLGLIATNQNSRSVIFINSTPKSHNQLAQATSTTTKPIKQNQVANPPSTNTAPKPQHAGAKTIVTQPKPPAPKPVKKDNHVSYLQSTFAQAPVCWYKDGYITCQEQH